MKGNLLVCIERRCITALASLTFVTFVPFVPFVPFVACRLLVPVPFRAMRKMPILLAEMQIQRVDQHFLRTVHDRPDPRKK